MPTTCPGSTLATGVGMPAVVALGWFSVKGHNRWHPDIPPVVKVDPGQVVGMETRDAFDGQVSPNSTAADLLKTSQGMHHSETGFQ